ncbi:MAG TPA: hypothetical protein PKW24_00400 [Clostridiales bacterium]|jgi:hypothetical protein|nr:hypothetical protein [Clostridiales bacterium]
MKNFLRTQAVILSLILLFATLASCSKKQEEVTTTPETTVETTDIEESSVPETQNEVESTQEDNDYETTTELTTTDDVTQPVTKDEVRAPQTLEEIVLAYNNALKNSSVACVLAEQKVVRGFVGIGSKGVNLMDEGEEDFRKTFEQNNKSGSKLSPLSPTDVASAKLDGKVATINLKSFESKSLSDSEKGYLNVVDNQRVIELVEAVENIANVNGFKVKSNNYKLSSGKLLVTFNDDFTKITAVEFTADQDVLAKISKSVLTITADIGYKLKSSYK